MLFSGWPTLMFTVYLDRIWSMRDYHAAVTKCFKYVLLIAFISSFSEIAFGKGEAQKIFSVDHVTTNTIAEATYVFRQAESASFNIGEVRELADSAWGFPLEQAPNYGYTSDIYWFKFTLLAPSNTEAGRYYYKINYPVLDHVGFYVEIENHIEREFQTGDAVAYSSRPIESNSFVLPLDLVAGEKQTVYVRLQSKGTLQLPATLLSEQQYRSSTLLFYIGQGLYFGVVGIMLFYNLMLFFAFRAKEYLSYVFYGCSITLLQFTMHGLSFQYLWPNSPWWNNQAILVSIFLSCLSMLIFTYYFLSLRSHSINLARIFKFFCVLLGCTVFLSFFISYANAIKAGASMGFISLLLCVFAALKAWKDRDLAVKQYVLGWSMVILGGIGMGLVMFGLIPSNMITSNAWQLGTGLEIIILSFALAEKIKAVNQRIEMERKKRFEVEKLALESVKLKEQNIVIQKRTSELELAQAELTRAKEHAEAITDSKTRFLAAASHDLRQPLHALELYIGALATQNSESMRQHIYSQMGKSARELSDLLTSLFDISRFDSNAVAVNISAIHVNEIIEGLESEFSELSEKNRIPLRVRKSNAVVESDPILMHRIVRGLVSNALCHSKKGRVLVGFRSCGESIRCEVWDSGQGISEFEQGNIYEEFYQIENLQRDRQQGLGLGLALIKRMCLALDHPMGLCSVLGRGSVFWFEMKKATSSMVLPLPHNDRTELSPLQGLTVLCVDDESAITEGLDLLLKGWGCVTILADSQTAVIERLKFENVVPDILICDYRLRGDINGVEVIESLMRDLKKKIPAILVTGDLDPNISKLSNENGIKLLQKPLSPAKLQLYILNMIKAFKT